MTDLAKLVVRLEAQTAQYMAQLDKANARLQRFDKTSQISATRIAKGVATAAIAAGAAFGVMTLKAIESADEMGKLAQKTGIAVESLSQLEYAAKLSNTSIDQVALGLNKLSKAAVAAARDAGGSAAKAFDKLGISVKNADGTMRGTEDLLLDIADKFAKMENGAAKAALAQELFGKSGTKLIPFLNEGRAGIEKLKKEADAFGLTITGKAAAAADQFGDDLDRLKFAAKGVTNQVAQAMLPVLQVMVTRFLESAKAGGAMQLAIATLAGAFKTLVTAGVIVTSVFEQLGRLVYGTAASIFRLSRGEFRLAAEEMSDAFNDAVNNVSADMDTIAMIWGEAVVPIQKAAEDMDDALEESLVFNDEKAGKKAKDAAEAALEALASLAQGVQQQVDTYGMAEGGVIRYRLAVGDLASEVALGGEASQQYVATIINGTDAMEKLKAGTEAAEKKQAAWNSAVEEGKSITEAMRTPAEAYAATIERLNKLLDDGHVSQETYNRAVLDAQDAFDKAAVGGKFWEEAMENAQDALAEFLANLGQGKSILEDFGRLLVKLAAQNLAAQIFSMGKAGSSGNFLGSLFSGIAGLFGAGASTAAASTGGSSARIYRDSGGRGYPGQEYTIGTGAQPERFVPDTAGTFIPNADQGMRVVNHFTLHAPAGSVSKATEMQIASAAARGVQRAQRRNG